jgi:hypothetical protein
MFRILPDLPDPPATSACDQMPRLSASVVGARCTDYFTMIQSSTTSTSRPVV